LPVWYRAKLVTEPRCLPSMHTSVSKSFLFLKLHAVIYTGFGYTPAFVHLLSLH
jgi:hypothetical protein